MSKWLRRLETLCVWQCVCKITVWVWVGEKWWYCRKSNERWKRESGPLNSQIKNLDSARARARARVKTKGNEYYVRLCHTLIYLFRYLLFQKRKQREFKRNAESYQSTISDMISPFAVTTIIAYAWYHAYNYPDSHHMYIILYYIIIAQSDCAE